MILKILIIILGSQKVCIFNNYIYKYNLFITYFYRKKKIPVAEHQKLSGTRFIFLNKQSVQLYKILTCRDS